MTNWAAVDVGGVREASGTTAALAGADLHAAAARVLGPPGPDGAGRTTLAPILTTLPEPGRGAASAGPVTGQAAVEELPAGRENPKLAGGYIRLPKTGVPRVRVHDSGL
jgi:ABC-type multidrug transport system ATPase subunit